MYYLRNWFLLRSLETLDSLQKCTRFTEKSLERNEGLQLGPWTNGGGGLAWIRRLWRRGRPRPRWGRCVGSPVTGSWPNFEQRSDQRRCSAAPGGRRPRLCCSGAAVVRPRQDAAQVGLGDRGEESRVVDRLGVPVEGRARWGAAMAAGGLGARTRRVQGALNRQAWCAGGSLRGEAYPAFTSRVRRRTVRDTAARSSRAG
jgi:hypothetical protein